jgi:glycerate 2-kinase
MREISATAHNLAGEIALAIYRDVLDAIGADRLIKDSVRRTGARLEIQNKVLDLDRFARVYVCGCGKASFGMARSLVEILCPYTSGGLVVTKTGHGGELPGIEVIEASHPVPDESSLEAGRKMLAFAAGAGPEDLVLFALSGGASALMESPVEGVTLKQIQDLNRKLLSEGASIFEMNAERSRLSEIKAGGLGSAFLPSTVGVLVLSDVFGDRLDTIGSGPFWNASSDEWIPSGAGSYWDQAGGRGYMSRHRKGTYSPLEYGIREVPERSKTEEFNGIEAPKLSGKVFHRFVGSSVTAVLHAHASAAKLGLRPDETVTMPLMEDARTEARRVAATSKKLAAGQADYAVFFGEPTVVIRGDGKGGRCQELACAAAALIEGIEGSAILAGSTDGTDGPTDVAGALVDGLSTDRAAQQGITVASALETSDSQSFLDACDGLIRTGPTQSNVNDIVIAVRSPGPDWTFPLASD